MTIYFKSLIPIGYDIYVVNNKNVYVFRMKQFLPNPKEDEKEEVDEFGSSRSDFGSKAYRIENTTE